MLPLFAEVPDWAPWATMTIGGAIAWGATWLSTRHEKRRSEKKEDEQTIVEHQGETIAWLTRELSDIKIRFEKLATMNGRMLGHIGYLEGLITGKGGIEFKRFDLDGTAEHKPVSAEGK